MAPPDEVMKAAARGLADLGVARQRRMLIVPGERGDRLLVTPQRSAASHGDTAAFHVNVSIHPVPWIAWRRRTTLAEVRSAPPKEGEGLVWDRLRRPTDWRDGVWEANPATAGAVGAEFAEALRTALEKTWLPLLPRAALRELLRAPKYAGPGLVAGDARVAQLLLAVEDMPANDLEDLVAYFERRGIEGELGQWLRMRLGDDLRP